MDEKIKLYMKEKAERTRMTPESNEGDSAST